MDDHMIYRIKRDIDLCFQILKYELSNKGIEEIVESNNYKAAKELIKAYNGLVKIYYKPEYVKYHLLGAVNKE